MIPKYVQEVLEKWSKKVGVSKEELLKSYNTLLENIAKGEPTPAEYKKALKLLKIALEEEAGSLLARGEMFYGYICGREETVDMIQRMRESVLRKAEDPAVREQLIREGKLTPDGQVLDYRRKTGEILSGEELLARLYAIVSEDKEFKNPKLAVIEARREGVESVKDVELFKFYSFRANRARKQKPDILRLSISNRGLKFREIEKPIDVFTLAGRLTTYSVTEAFDLYYKECEGKDSSPYFMIQGTVSDIDYDSRYNRRLFVLTEPEDLALGDENNFLLCRLRDIVPVNFVKGSDVVAIGRLRLLKNSGKIVADVDGYLLLE